jgi:hypothetical protein
MIGGVDMEHRFWISERKSADAVINRLLPRGQASPDVVVRRPDAPYQQQRAVQQTLLQSSEVDCKYYAYTRSIFSLDVQSAQMFE